MATALPNTTITSIASTAAVRGKNHPSLADVANVPHDELLSNDGTLETAINSLLTELSDGSEDIQGKDRRTYSPLEALGYILQGGGMNGILWGGDVQWSGTNILIKPGVWRIAGKLQVTTADTSVTGPAASNIWWVKVTQSAGNAPTLALEDSLATTLPDKGPGETAGPFATSVYSGYVRDDGAGTKTAKRFALGGQYVSPWTNIETTKSITGAVTLNHLIGVNPAYGYNGFQHYMKLLVRGVMPGNFQVSSIRPPIAGEYGDNRRGLIVSNITAFSVKIIAGADACEYIQRYLVRGLTENDFEVYAPTSIEFQLIITRPLHHA